ncbi:hypothetical protein DTO282F9_6260 [Paecilomyces variotii]|nr:hypothetical protein DTO282F9_6260 [Paecilomyces variotii]
MQSDNDFNETEASWSHSSMDLAYLYLLFFSHPQSRTSPLLRTLRTSSIMRKLKSVSGDCLPLKQMISNYAVALVELAPCSDRSSFSKG